MQTPRKFIPFLPLTELFTASRQSGEKSIWRSAELVVGPVFPFGEAARVDRVDLFTVCLCAAVTGLEN